MPYQQVATEILQSAKILVADKTRVMTVFRAAGIELDNNLNLVGFLDKPEICINRLTDNLQYVPALKAAAERIFRKRVIMFKSLEDRRTEG